MNKFCFYIQTYAQSSPTGLLDRAQPTSFNASGFAMLHPTYAIS